MRAILKYTSVYGNGKDVIRVLAQNDIEILKTKRLDFGIYHKTTILVDDYSKLSKLLYELNRTCTYEAILVKTYRRRTFIDFLKSLTQCRCK